mmetsp:Transcript_204/g.198  ORF Transcript_204/g.198 Transcript_204/m.198 type:complete len:97 (+) Transcript_204:67-357(+)
MQQVTLVMTSERLPDVVISGCYTRSNVLTLNFYGTLLYVPVICVFNHGNDKQHQISEFQKINGSGIYFVSHRHPDAVRAKIIISPSLQTKIEIPLM